MHGYGPSLWLASNSYDELPKRRTGFVNEGTKTPIPEDFESPWIGRQVDDLTKWLRRKPKDADLNDRHFAVLDTGARGDPPTIVVCRIGDLHGEGSQLFMFRWDIGKGVDFLIGAPPDVWDENSQQGKLNAKIEYDDEDE